MNPDRPTIRLQLNDQLPDSRVADVLHGIEEEGVPVEVTRHEERNPLTLAHEASLESRLGVGIGISLDFVVVTTEKLVASMVAAFIAASAIPRTGPDASSRQAPMPGSSKQATTTPSIPSASASRTCLSSPGTDIASS